MHIIFIVHTRENVWTWRFYSFVKYELFLNLGAKAHLKNFVTLEEKKARKVSVG